MRTKFSYTGLCISDMEKAIAFYSKLLGMRIAFRRKVSYTRGEVCLLKSGGKTLELNAYRGKRPRPGTTLDHLAFETDDLEGIAAALKKRGVKTYERLDTGGWSRLFLKDPDGNWVEIFQKKRRSALRSY